MKTNHNQIRQEGVSIHQAQAENLQVSRDRHQVTYDGPGMQRTMDLSIVAQEARRSGVLLEKFRDKLSALGFHTHLDFSPWGRGQAS